MNPLQALIRDELRSQGISRSVLIKWMGYKNVTKGLRRLDDYLESLNGADFFQPLLTTVLQFQDKRLDIAVFQLRQQLEDTARAAFKPIIKVIPASRPSPIFVAAMVPKLLNIQVPKDLDTLPEAQALDVVRGLYAQHRLQYTGWPKGKGFIYHKNYEESFEFDQAGVLIKRNQKHIGISSAVLRIAGKELPSHILNVQTSENRE